MALAGFTLVNLKTSGRENGHYNQALRLLEVKNPNRSRAMGHEPISQELKDKIKKIKEIKNNSS